MKPVQDIAELLIASWILASDGVDDPAPLPTSHGLLDRALRQALAKGAFPAAWKERLHFVDSRTGLQCVELDGVIGAAQRAEFTQEPNPSYRETRIKIGPRAARILLRRQGVKEDDARTWGRTLHEALEAAKKTMADFPPVR